MAGQVQTPELRQAQAQISPKMMEEARPLLNKAALLAITMIQGTFDRTVLMDQNPLPAMVVEGGMAVNIATAEDGRNAMANVTLTARGRRVEGAPEGEYGFNVVGIYRLSYVALDGELDPALRAKALTAIVSMGAINHVWSFWREFVLQSCQRMGIPPFLVPLLFTMNPVENPPATEQAVQAASPKPKHSKKNR